MSRATAIATAFLASTLATPSALASSSIMFILDGSGSMWGQVDGISKIETAKAAMTDMLDSVPADARIGLMTYGTTSKGSCDDVVQLNALGTDRAAVKTSINALTPLGKTPIDLALLRGIATMNAQSGDVQNSLVLVSDGIETCNGNPCKVAATAKASGVVMKVHVVGFDVDADARAQLECIARAGEGRYFNAADTNGFQQALNQVVLVAQAEPAPKPEMAESGPSITEFFRDDFDGDALNEVWAVENPNPDSFIVEDGFLTMLSTDQSGMAAEKPENLITYTGKLPKGDWNVDLTYIGEYGAASDRLQLGLRKSGKEYMAASYNAKYASGSGCFFTTLELEKAAGGKSEGITEHFRSSKGQHCQTATEFEPWEQIRADHQNNNVTLTLSKRGRAYTASVAMDGYKDADGNPVVLTTDKFTSLRSPGELSFTIDRLDRYGVEGEVLMMIDSLVISSVDK